MIMGPLATVGVAAADGAGLTPPLPPLGLFLVGKRRSLEVIGQATLPHWHCIGTVCRWLGRLYPLAAFEDSLRARLGYVLTRRGGRSRPCRPAPPRRTSGPPSPRSAAAR